MQVQLFCKKWYNSRMTKQEDFVATVSHELRTPLTSIRGFAQTMLASWDKISDEDKKKFLKIIEDQSNRLIGLVENILSVSYAVNNDKPVLKKANIKQVLEPVLKVIGQKYPKYLLKTQFNPKLPDGMIDIERFQQIMTNLIENACKYSPEGSSVIVSGDFADKEGYFVIKVSDEGVGISEDDKTRVFEKFARIDNPLTRSVQGNGLGLYITKKLVELMNGSIDFSKNDGKGTTFEVKLPFYNPEEQICSAVY